MGFGRMAAGLGLAAAVCCGCSSGQAPRAERASASVPPAGPSSTAAPTASPTAVPVKPKKFDKAALDRELRRYLGGRASGAGIHVLDRTTGRRYSYRPDTEFVTASVAKLDILMTLLLKRQKAHRGLSADEKYDAGIMIRESDNFAADRNFRRAGSATGVNAANRRSFRLKHTEAIDAQCLDLLCWSLTRTTPRDQERLMENLFSGPLERKHRDFVLGLMSEVVKDQRWGVGAGALKGDRVYNKNGWMTHQRDGDRWAVNSVGRIEGHGHDLLVAVMTNHNPSMGYGITTAEHLVARVADAFRATTPAV
ncbi:serine hydrolase [Actinocorallia longicatena]|uniref:Beta-lactamase class A catalytic domain-containing protein n=1 Tax=Actinocorallia longicatena TaxID=111803 RepID=A0ABP6Q3K8_9ACTN